ncbi:MAG: XrtA system polysaccharide deacetylase [Desulfomonilia bacterium]
MTLTTHRRVMTPLAEKFSLAVNQDNSPDSHYSFTSCKERWNHTIVAGVKNALTIDLEEYFQIHALSTCISPDAWSGYPSHVEGNTSVLLDLLDQHEVKATFFCLGWIGEKHERLIERIHLQGHEIACHGFAHQVIYQQDHSQFRMDVDRAKKVLEDACGCPVVGYRAPTYSIRKDTLWALDVLEQVGFSYDSSIFPIFHDNYGIPDAPRFPHRLPGLHLVEFPLTTVKLGPFNLPVSGGGYFRLLPYVLTKHGLRSFASSNGPFIFYIHPWEINPDTPRVENMDIVSYFRTYVGIRGALAKLDRLLTDFEFAPARDVLKSLDLL